MIDLINVVFPIPFGPTIAMASCFRVSILIGSARTLSYPTAASSTVRTMLPDFLAGEKVI